jgi:hypothetical protein
MVLKNSRTTWELSSLYHDWVLCIASRNVTWTLGGRRSNTGWRQGDFTDISIIIHLYLDPLLRADAVRSVAVMAAAQCHSWSGDKIWSFVYETEWERGFWLLHSTCFFCGVFFLCNPNDFQSRLRKSYDDELRIWERKGRRGINWTNSSWHQTLLKEMIVGHGPTLGFCKEECRHTGVCGLE